jgi:hypothetical protein
MPSYIQLASEPVWGWQFVPPNLQAMIERVRIFYNLGPTAVGAAGDNNHLYGRHRSANWDRTSIYCTDRSYGTVNAKDKTGDQNWYRAIDTGIQGQTLIDASHRMDNLVRSGAAPGVAEWFGTFDGQVVVGWYEGHSSSSDSSHLYHLHAGLWNQYANDPVTLGLVYGAITGEDDGMPTAEELWNWVPPNDAASGFPNPNYYKMYQIVMGNNAGIYVTLQNQLGGVQTSVNEVLAKVNDVSDSLDECCSGEGGGAPIGGAVNLTPQAISAVAEATADEIRRDPERDGDDT